MSGTTKSHSMSRLNEILKVLKQHHITKGITPVKLRQILEDLGPTYAKLGQIMSMRSDMLPESYCKELTKLQAEVKPLPFSQILPVIEEELGGKASQFFLKIDEKPVGSASIAQVHPAVLITGEEVVIKVQRPAIRETMAEDIVLMHKAVRLLKIAMGTGDLIDFNALIDELWKITQEEMDFLKEAGNYKLFAEKHKDIQYVTCPVVIEALSTEKLIVMSYLSGTPIDQLATLLSLGYDMTEIGEKAAENYCKQILDDGFFHADPHPGNIWIGDGKIIWLDMGMMGHLSEHIKNLMKKAILSIIKNDIYELKNVILALGEAKGHINHARLYSDIDEIVSKYISMDLGSMHLGELTERLLDLVKNHNIAMPTDITLLGRGIVTMEGLLAVCSPNVDFLQIMSNHMSTSILHNLDIKGELKHTARSLYNVWNQSLMLPIQLSELFKLAKNGHLKLNLDITEAQEPLSQITSMINHLVLSIISAALFLSSSILCTAKLPPFIWNIPMLALIGYVLAFLLLFYLLYRIWITRRRKK